MAYSTTFKVKNDSLLPPGTALKVYNFDRRVTTFGGGDRADVMLLQALFRMFYYEFTGFEEAPEIPGGSNGVIKVDGIVGPQTRLHIQDYQQRLLRDGLTKTVDGVMDPMKKQGVKTTNTQVKYQLEILNVDCLVVCKANDSVATHQRMIDLDMHALDVYPNALRSALRVQKPVP